MIFQSSTFITSITKHFYLVFVCARLRTLPHIFAERSCAPLSRLHLSASVVCKHHSFANICACSHLVANLGESSKYLCIYNTDKYCFSYVIHLSALVLVRAVACVIFTQHMNIPANARHVSMLRQLCSRYCIVCHKKLDTNFEALKPYVCSSGLCAYLLSIL